jgi:hypothetical protein
MFLLIITLVLFYDLELDTYHKNKILTFSNSLLNTINHTFMDETPNFIGFVLIHYSASGFSQIRRISGFLLFSTQRIKHMNTI